MGRNNFFCLDKYEGGGIILFLVEKGIIQYKN